MSPTRYAVISIRALLAFMWSGVAIAAVTTSPEPPAAWLLGFAGFLALLSGGTALAMRISKFLNEQDQLAAVGQPMRPLVAPGWFAAAHMGGAVLAGAMVFLWNYSATNAYQLLGYVVAASFGGAKVLELATEKVFPTNPTNPPANSERTS